MKDQVLFIELIKILVVLCLLRKIINAMNAMHEKLKKFGIPYVTIDDFNEIERELMTLLSSHRGGGKQ